MNSTQAPGFPHDQLKGGPGLATLTAVCLFVSVAVFVPLVSSCAGLSRERLIYDKNNVRIGVQQDSTTSRSSPLALNSHPAHLSATDLQTLLRFLQVSGYSGTIGGVFATPRPIPLFSEDELQLITQPLANAFAQAGPQERVFFSIPNLSAPYNEDRTAGAIFIRGSYLHVILIDHTAFLSGDTAGGEDLKDPRDTKGMQLWVSRPLKAATLPPEQEPHWGVFERVHISLNYQQALASPMATTIVEPTPTSSSSPALSPRGESRTTPTGDSSEDLRLQVRELTSSNLELRARLKEQAEAMRSLKEEIERLRQELNDEKTISTPSPNAHTR